MKRKRERGLPTVWLRAPRLLTALVLGVPAVLGAQAYSIPGVTQTGTSSTEKKPTSRDPRYVPPFLPEYLKRKIDPSAGLLLSSSEGLDVEAFLRARAAQKAGRKGRFSRYESRDYTDSADSEEDRRLFEMGMLRQFGVTLPGLQYAPNPPYHETAGRRFQVVFLLSLPITAVFSFGIVTAFKGTFGRSAALNQSETIGVALGGLLSSGFIAFRDLRLWREDEKRRLLERDRPKGALLTERRLPSDYALSPSSEREELVVPIQITIPIQF